MYCYHIMGRTDMDAVRIYRDSFVPSPHLSEPQALATAIVVVGRDGAEAEALARPHLRVMVAFRDGSLGQPQLLVGQESSLPPMTEQGKATEAMFRESWIIGAADSVAEQTRALARELDVDEIMINPVAAAYETDPPDRTPNREFILRALRDALQIQTHSNQ
jgi:alkanesulfonate monooxygenase SsuD/methylene tetrahydromethanopterin reductase-like flavin-dependent oxidoreductase (luciferase family)